MINVLRNAMARVSVALVGERFSYTYTDVTHEAMGGAPINSIVGYRSSRPNFRYIFVPRPAPGYDGNHWRRVPKFLVSSPKYGISDQTGSGETQREALRNCFTVGIQNAQQIQWRGSHARLNMVELQRMFDAGLIPPMFDTAVETD